MRSNSATTRRVRLVTVLSVAAAVTVMLGAILVAASVVMRLLTRHQPAHMARLGLDVVAAGIGFGLVVLVGFAIARIGGPGRSRPSPGRADHRKGAARPHPAPASGGHGRSPGHGRSQGQSHGKDRLRAGAPPAGSGHAGRDGGTRPARPPVLKPTNVYSPGGLIDVPRDGRAPGGQDIPEILRTAGPTPAAGAPPAGAPAGGRSQDRPPPGRAGAPPRPGYQPGMGPGGPGRAPYPPGGPPPPMPPRDRMRPREAPRTGHPVPPRGAAQGHAGPLRASGLLRDAGPPREGMPRDGMGPGTGPGGPNRPGGPVPPRDPAYPPPPGQVPGQGQGQGQRGGAGRHATGPGYAASGGRRPGHAGPPGPTGPAEPSGQFDGGYAYVIRASDNPVRPAGPARPPGFGRAAGSAWPQGQGPTRPATLAGEAPADVYVYRDTDGQAEDPGTAASRPAEQDASYWYDLPGTGPGTGSGGGASHVVEETRGPFEPLLSSAGPPGTTPRLTASPDSASPGAAQDNARPAEAPGGPDDQNEDTAHAQARKLEQIKDLYLTAEAIGEANVDKHFDQLLTQQRELISEYFKQSSAGRPAAGHPGEPEAEPASSGGSGDAAGPAGGPQSARVAADQPRAW